jgi:hypothetical protein
MMGQYKQLFLKLLVDARQHSEELEDEARLFASKCAGHLVEFILEEIPDS